jgi:hypothetical protein
MPSHTVLSNYIERTFKRDFLKNKTLIEIGSSREIIKQQNSSEYFIKFCKKYEMKFISIDMDPECSNNVKKFAEDNKFDNIQIITDKGETFLKNYKNPIDFIYIDAFDFWHENHSKKRKESYKKNLNVELNSDDILCHKMHFDCAFHMINNNLIKKDTVLSFDDILNKNATKGKGVTAIPFLLKNNMTVVEYKNCGMILRLKNNF